MKHLYDMLVIGAGQAGLPLASALAQKGWRVAVAERKHLGGSCVNFGCTPTKAVLASAKLAYQAKKVTEFGLTIPTVEGDYSAVLERARRIAAESREGLKKTFDEGNPELLEGHAKFVGRDGTNVMKVQKKKEKIVLTFNRKSDTSKSKDVTAETFASNSQEAQTLEASHLFVATGRKPNTDDLGLESISVNVNDKGIIEVDECLATNVPGVWAAGDVRGGGMFTHSSYDDYSPKVQGEIFCFVFRFV